MQGTLFRRRAFTLIELLLVIGIMASLAGIVITAVNPSKQLQSAGMAGRRMQARSIEMAMQQYYIDKGGYPNPSDIAKIIVPSAEHWINVVGNAFASLSLVSEKEQIALAHGTPICKKDISPDPDAETIDCMNLDPLAPTYLTALPVDDAEATERTSGFKIYITGNQVTVVGPVERCGDGTCNNGEDAASCASDCLLSCGNNVCDEAIELCPRDCGCSMGRWDGTACNEGPITITWTGGSSSYWDDPLNWDYGLPQDGDTVNLGDAGVEIRTDTTLDLPNTIVNCSQENPGIMVTGRIAGGNFHCKATINGGAGGDSETNKIITGGTFTRDIDMANGGCINGGTFSDGTMTVGGNAIVGCNMVSNAVISSHIINYAHLQSGTYSGVVDNYGYIYTEGTFTETSTVNNHYRIYGSWGSYVLNFNGVVNNFGSMECGVYRGTVHNLAGATIDYTKPIGDNAVPDLTQATVNRSGGDTIICPEETIWDTTAKNCL